MFLMKEQVIQVKGTIKILIEKRLKVEGLSNYITVRSEDTYAVIPEILQKGVEIVTGTEFESRGFEILARVDLLRIAVRCLGVEYDAIVVENVMCESTTEAYKAAISYNKDKWKLIHMEGTKNWNKES